MGVALGAMLPAGCVMENHEPDLVPGDEYVKLRLMVGVSAPSPQSDQSTRAAGEYPDGYPYDFEKAATVYEGIHTIRVIVVTPQDTVEGNNRWSFSDHIPQPEDLYGEMVFRVKGGEKKRVYLIANEDYITPKVDFASYTRGSKLTKEDAAKLLQYNEWPAGSTSSEPDQAVPYIDNTGNGKKSYLPMSEFFDIFVNQNPNKNPTDTYEQSETLFITRNAVKFGFSIKAETDDNSSYRITAITFNNLMQKSYLFPNETVYSPSKEADRSDIRRIITQFTTPPLADNLLRPYTFTPASFGINCKGWNTNYDSIYAPQLYFAETRNNLDGNNTFTMDVEVTFDGDTTNNKVLYKNVRMPNLPTFPRNTFVKVNFTMKDHVLSAQVDVIPYIGVVLNPIFGFNKIKPDGPEDPGDADWPKRNSRP